MKELALNNLLLYLLSYGDICDKFAKNLQNTNSFLQSGFLLLIDLMPLYKGRSLC